MNYIYTIHMRTNTKIKQLLKEHTLTFSLNRSGAIDIIITNNETGNSHLSTGASLSAATASAFSDTQKVKKQQEKQQDKDSL
jgi:hypothetical protein